MLSRRVGVAELDAIEDAVQSSLMTALYVWTRDAVPDDPSAWLYRVAHNRVVGDLRKRGGRRRLLSLQAEAQDEPVTDALETHFEGEVSDDLLRMLFVCCDEAIPEESRLVLALKTLCGFGVREISIRLFITEANTYKRLGRAKERLRQTEALDDELPRETLTTRLSSVRKVLYVLFTEGYLSSHAEHAIRRELCDEALRLATLLAEHSVGNDPETFALVSLMHLHRARTSARQDGSGGLLLLEEQDRNLWEQPGIALGLEWLARSAEGDHFSRYHAEAGIAAEPLPCTVFSRNALGSRR